MTFWQPPKWGGKPKAPDETALNSLGVVNDVLRDEAGASAHITVEVRGISGFPSGVYRLAYSPGASLGDYLKRVKLRYAGMTNAVYDYRNLERGRCRMTYVPLEGAKIVIGKRDMGPAFEFQRTSVDAQQLAANMGRQGWEAAPKIVEVKKHRP